MHVFAAWSYGKKQGAFILYKYTLLIIIIDFILFGHVPCMHVTYQNIINCQSNVINYTIYKQTGKLINCADKILKEVRQPTIPYTVHIAMTTTSTMTIYNIGHNIIYLLYLRSTLQRVPAIYCTMLQRCRP